MNVLIADDNPDFRSTLKRILGSGANIDEVWEAEDGEEAVRLACELRPDLVLMDLAMPRIDGLEATRMIKERLPSVRVFVLTAYGEPIYHRAASANGADAFLPKSDCVSGLEKVGALNLKGVEPTWMDRIVEE